MAGIIQYINEYKILLMQPENDELRSAFIRKFDGICKAAKN